MTAMTYDGKQDGSIEVSEGADHVATIRQEWNVYDREGRLVASKRTRADAIAETQDLAE